MGQCTAQAPGQAQRSAVWEHRPAQGGRFSLDFANVERVWK